jgi:hypothetical protein
MFQISDPGWAMLSEVLAVSSVPTGNCSETLNSHPTIRCYKTSEVEVCR